MIIGECINCDVYGPECPNDAISIGPEIYVIDPGKCTGCVGYFDEPQRQQVYPADCTSKDPAHEETCDQLIQKYTQFASVPSRAA